MGGGVAGEVASWRLGLMLGARGRDVEGAVRECCAGGERGEGVWEGCVGARFVEGEGEGEGGEDAVRGVGEGQLGGEGFVDHGCAVGWRGGERRLEKMGDFVLVHANAFLFFTMAE